MRRLLLWSSVAGFTACLLQPTLATITPDYGYADGCQSVIIQGHHLGESATAKLVGAGGSADFIDLVPAEKDPSLPDHAQDVGFKYFGTVPASPDGGTGWYDVVLTVDGEDLTINDGWYYRSCPGAIVVDAYDVPADATVGTTLTFQGCNLTSDTEVQFVDPATGDIIGSAAMVSDCSSAFTHVEVPNLPAGVYAVQLARDPDAVYPLQVCIGHSAFPVTAHSGYTGCDPVTVTIPAR